MTLDIDLLNPQSVRDVISRLWEVRQNLRWGIEDAVDMLARDGATVAQDAYGSMTNVTGYGIENEGHIIVTGGEPVIAEFGAGYATMEDHPWAGAAPVPIEVGSYSRENGGEFWERLQNSPEGEAFWVFGGRRYSRVEARHGLLNARNYIMEHSTETVRRAVHL